MAHMYWYHIGVIIAGAEGAFSGVECLIAFSRSILHPHKKHFWQAKAATGNSSRNTRTKIAGKVFPGNLGL